MPSGKVHVETFVKCDIAVRSLHNYGGTSRITYKDICTACTPRLLKTPNNVCNDIPRLLG